MNCSSETAKNGYSMLKVCLDAESVAQASAKIFVEQSKLAITRSEKFSVVLSGGETPLRTYELLASRAFRNQVDWSRVHVFFGDERCVDSDDPRSNDRMAELAFLSLVPIPRLQIHPIQSALAYEAVLKKYFGSSPPSFDLIYLGLGQDGHTASLFPDSEALKELARWAVLTQNQNEKFARITMTLPILNLGKMVVFLVTGSEKAEVLKEVLAQSPPTRFLPAKLIQPKEGQILWLVDQLAHPLMA